MQGKQEQILPIGMFAQTEGFSRISEENPNQEGKQFSRKNVMKDHIQVRYDESSSTYKINFGSWFDFKNHNTINLGFHNNDPSDLFISIDSGESGKPLTNAINSYFASHKKLVTRVLEHLGIKYGPMNPVSEFIPVKLTHEENFGYIFLIDKKSYEELKKPKSMFKVFGFEKFID